jgi:sulfide dehydrogenase [flavocytochrome c] flavoprotein subunit
MPRSASAAQSQAEICAAAIVKLSAGEKAGLPTLTSSCYSLLAPDYAISQLGTFRPEGDQYVEPPGAAIVSPVAASRAVRGEEAHKADAWYAAITSQVFG